MTLKNKQIELRTMLQLKEVKKREETLEKEKRYFFVLQII